MNKIKMNFNNVIDGAKPRLQFYELYHGTELVEYAYFTKESKSITYKTYHGDINKVPKEDLGVFMDSLYNKVNLETTGERGDLRSKSSNPHFGLRISKRNISLIHMFIIHKGLLGTLDFLNIKYQIVEKRDNSAFMNLKISDPKKKYLCIYCTTKIEEYMVAGLKNGQNMIFPVSLKKLDSKELYNPFLETKGKSFPRILHDGVLSFIDNTSEKILKIYDMPTNMFDLLGKYIPKYIFNNEIDDIKDIKNQRIRMSEAISHSAYSMVQQGLVRLKNQKKTESNYSAKLELHPFAVINAMQESGMFQYTQTTNPLEELLLSAKITKTGLGNPKKEQITLEKRDLNRSYFGTVAATTTNEYGGIGQSQTLTNKATISDRYGSIKIQSFDNDRNPFENLSATESLLPFYEYDDTTRRVMGNQQFSQFIQLENPDHGMVQTGFESAVPYLVSDRFAIKAKADGKITSISNGVIEQVTSNHSIQKYSTKDRKSRTKRGIYLPLKYNTLVQKNQYVKKGEIIASSNSLKTGKLAVGKNLVVALMSYRGMNYEDGWVASDTLKTKYASKMYEKITILVPVGAKLSTFDLFKDKETKPGDILINYTKENSEEIEKISKEEEHSELMSGVEFAGKEVRYRSPGGKIKEIIIKLNSTHIDTKIQTMWRETTKDMKKSLAECELLRHDNERFVDCTSNIDNTETLVIGGHKTNGYEFEGAIIEVFLERVNPIRSGSKFTLGGTGGKGTIQYIYKEKDAPVAAQTKMKVEFIPTPVSIIGRKNPSILLNLYSGKIIYYLNLEVQDLIRAGNISKARSLLLEVMSCMDVSKNQFIITAIKETMGQSPKQILALINSSHPLTKPAFPLLVPPHLNKITIKNIQDAANVMKIPLNEKVYVPEEGITTEKAVPVGILNVYLLEHFPQAMSSARSSLFIKSQQTTGQGRSGSKVGAGATKIGLYDLFSMAYQQPALLLKELHGTKSDNSSGAFKIQKSILKDGKMPIIETLKIDSNTESKTKLLIEAYFRGAMLDPKL